MDPIDLIKELQMLGGTGGMENMNQLRRPQTDPRVGAVQQMMQMMGGGQLPPELPQQMMSRGRNPRVVPQTGRDVENQIQGQYGASAEGQQNRSENTFGRVPPPPDPSAAFRGTRNPMTDVIEGQPVGTRGPYADRPYQTPAHEGTIRAAPEKTTEEDLQQVYDQIDYQAGDDVDTSQDEWPETPEEFKRKYGRDPATDSEMEFYYGSNEDPGDSAPR